MSEFSVIRHGYPYGDVTVDWKMVEDILAKDIEDITEEECQKNPILNQYGVNWDINEIMSDPVGHVEAMENACNDPKFVEEYNKIINKYDSN